MFHKYNSKLIKKCNCFFSTSNNVSSPLNGIRVLDMTRILAGPLASQILGDMGAEIIKIEQPNEGN
jgi:crotonobetainyl-CoA:carnitine CoA-transferase CaiB-like acyl-CoA transferase